MGTCCGCSVISWAKAGVILSLIGSSILFIVFVAALIALENSKEIPPEGSSVALGLLAGVVALAALMHVFILIGMIKRRTGAYKFWMILLIVMTVISSIAGLVGLFAGHGNPGSGLGLLFQIAGNIFWIVIAKKAHARVQDESYSSAGTV